jgi:ubiquinone/menaquinone biosynthesis C-methylase UbiE
MHGKENTSSILTALQRKIDYKHNQSGDIGKCTVLYGYECCIPITGKNQNQPVMKPLNYRFYEVEHCNMCGAATHDHKVLGQRLNTSQGLRPKKKKGISTTVMQCTNCGLIYSNPQPIPYSIQDHYGIVPEEYWVADYFTVDPNYFTGAIEKAKKLISFQPGMKALDIGAGIGKCLISLKNAGFDAYGFEPSDTFYDRAIRVMGIKPENLRKGMVEEMNYEDNTFDFITFGAVLEHLYDPDRAIARAMKWLKPNGVMHIEVPSSKHLVARIFNLYYRLRGTNYVTNISPMHSPFHMYEFGLKSFQENQKKNNYTIAQFEYYVCEIVGIPKLFHPFLRWYMRKTNKGMQLEVWLKKNS